MIRDASDGSDRPRRMVKPFQGGEDGDNSKHLVSQARYHAVTGWRTMKGNDEFYWATSRRRRLYDYEILE